MHFTNLIYAISLGLIALILIVLSKKLRQRFQAEFNQNNQIPHPNGKGSGVNLTRLNGCGMTFKGKFREAFIDEYHTYVTYYMLSIVFVPLIPFKAYRVISPSSGSYQVLGSENMKLKEVGVIFLKAIGIITSIAAGAFMLMFICNILDYFNV